MLRVNDFNIVCLFPQSAQMYWALSIIFRFFFGILILR